MVGWANRIRCDPYPIINIMVWVIKVPKSHRVTCFGGFGGGSGSGSDNGDGGRKFSIVFENNLFFFGKAKFWKTLRIQIKSKNYSQFLRARARMLIHVFFPFLSLSLISSHAPKSTNMIIIIIAIKNIKSTNEHSTRERIETTIQLHKPLIVLSSYLLLCSHKICQAVGWNEGKRNGKLQVFGGI